MSVSTVPGAHAVHVVSLPAENEPGLQIAHVVAGFESVSAVPGSHSVHEEAVAYAPEEHVAHGVVETPSLS